MSEIHPESSAVDQVDTHDSSEVTSLRIQLKNVRFKMHTAVFVCLGVIAGAVLRDQIVQGIHEANLIASKRDLLRELNKSRQEAGALKEEVRDLKLQLNIQQQPRGQRAAVPLVLADPIEEPEKQNPQDVVVEGLPHSMTPEERVRRAVTDQALKMQQDELKAQQEVGRLAMLGRKNRAKIQSRIAK